VCPLIKSSFGSVVGGCTGKGEACPHFGAVDAVVGESTCDGKKKMYELMQQFIPTYLIDLPQKPDTPAARQYYLSELEDFCRYMERLTGNQITSYSYNALKGISIKDRASNNTVSQNVVGSNKQGGIVLDNLGQGVPTGNRILNNRVGISRNGTAIGNVLSGIHIISAQTTVIGPGNIVANNPVGIQIDGTDSDRNKITRNSIYNNTNLGIDLAPTGVTPNDSGDGDSGPNEQLNFPVLQTASTQQVTGTACGGCTVEIFIADNGANAYGEGKTFVGSAVASSNGIFKVNVGGVTQGQFVTATATDTAGNTSEFSLNARIQ
jgi:hypothetical protein